VNTESRQPGNDSGWLQHNINMANVGRRMVITRQLIEAIDARITEITSSYAFTQQNHNNEELNALIREKQELED